MMVMAGWYLLIFLLPLLLWAGWLCLKLDVATMKQWLLTQFGWLDQMKGKHALLPSAKISLSTLSERLKSPDLEWAGYSKGTQMKDLLFSLGAVGITAIGLIAVYRKKLRISNREIWLSSMASITIGLYSIWYFFIHQHMWQRHFQPAVYTGFGLFVFWGAKVVKHCTVDLRPLFYAVAVLLLAIQTVQEVKHPLVQSQWTYARSCTDLYDTQCEPLDQK